MKQSGLHIAKSILLFLFISFQGISPSTACDIINDSIPSRILKASVQAITTHEGHRKGLEDAFERAQTKILVTNYGNLYSSVLNTRLFQELIPAACQKGVKVYFRYNYDDKKDNRYPPIHRQVQEYLDNYGVNVAWVQTHAKIVAVDHQLVMMGSFNWLTDFASPPKYRSFNRSIVYQGEGTYQMIEDIWKVIKYYRNKEFGGYNPTSLNYKQAYLFKRNPHNQESKEYDLGKGSTLSYVPVIEEHRRKILNIFERAEDRIVILSPFVSGEGPKTYQRDFIIPLLTNALKRNITVCFVCLPEHEQKIRSYLNPLLMRYPHLKLLSYANIHAKTILMDDKLIAEGSFNWLCAARDEIYSSHKHEATLSCEGPIAKHLIREFYQTPVGKFVEKTVVGQQRYSGSNKRKRDHSEKTSTCTFKAKRQKTEPLSPSQTTSFFFQRQEEVNKDMWVNHPFWVPYATGYNYFINEKFFEVMSGETFSREGYCVRINKQEYITDDAKDEKDPEIKYFPTSQKAKEAAYDIFKQH